MSRFSNGTARTCAVTNSYRASAVGAAGAATPSLSRYRSTSAGFKPEIVMNSRPLCSEPATERSAGKNLYEMSRLAAASSPTRLRRPYCRFDCGPDGAGAGYIVGLAAQVAGARWGRIAAATSAGEVPALKLMIHSASSRSLASIR
jgi:hypothetical protein